MSLAPRNIVENAFEKHFPAFRDLSPFDPVRVLADAVASSWKDLAADQEHVFRRVLDALPDLLGYHAHSARPHVAVASFAAGPNGSATFTQGIRIAIQAETPGIEGELVSDVSVAPAEWVSHSVNDDLHTFEFSCGPVSAITFLFLPAATQGLPVSSLTLEGLPDVILKDETEGFAHEGGVTLSGKNGRLLSTGGTLKFGLRCAAGRGVGEFLLGSGRVSLFQKLQWMELGKLSGRAWEEIVLPPGLIRVPSELQVQLPTGARRTLELASGDQILEARSDSQPKNPNIFIYHSGRHSLLFPYAPEICQGFLAAFPIVLEPCEKIIDPLLLITPAPAKVRTPLRGADENVRITRILSGARPRETGEALRKRFFASLREHKRTWVEAP